ncbi:MAG: hypothetical protein QNI92_12230 [Desulfobacterales bacterium]|nr:hypothetical protein [Desulfobacterales bacterium]MDJ0912441.1 hypothetical protein [Desulfobacterales bacterium]
MSIRIDLISDKSETVVRIAGRLAGSTVAQLEKVCELIENRFLMDLSDLRFADDGGIKAIQAMAEKGVQVHGASPFVQLLLDNDTNWKADGRLSKAP